MTDTDDDLYRIKLRLTAYYTGLEIDEWMTSPHPQLDGKAPEYVIRLGNGAMVHEIIDRLDTDAFI